MTEDKLALALPSGLFLSPSSPRLERDYIHDHDVWSQPFLPPTPTLPDGESLEPNRPRRQVIISDRAKSAISLPFEVIELS